MTEHLSKHFSKLVLSFVEQGDERLLNLYASDPGFLRYIFPGKEMEGFRHDLAQEIRALLFTMEFTPDLVDLIATQKEVLKVVLTKALDIGDREFRPMSVEKFIPPTIYKEGGNEPRVTQVRFVNAISAEDRGKRVNQSVGFLLARLSSNVHGNMSDLVGGTDERVFAPVITIDDLGMEGYFVANSGPLMAGEVFLNLGEKGLSTKHTHNGPKRGTGLASLAEAASDEGCALIAAQWEEGMLEVRNLTTRQHTMLVGPHLGRTENMLGQIGMDVMKRALNVYEKARGEIRSKPNVAFGIVGPKGCIFEPRQAPIT